MARRSYFDPLTGRQIRRQARRDVRAATMPLVRQIGREALSGERNVAGIAEALAAAQGGYGARVADIYGRARQSLGALDTAQQGALGQTGGESTLAAELASRLALSGSDTGQSQAFRQMTQGAAGAGFSRGSAELAALVQRQAAGEEYGAKLPGLARLAGLQGVNERAARQRQDIARLQAGIPTTVAGLIRESRAREFQKAAARLAYQGDVYAQQAATERTMTQQAGANARTAAQQAGANQRAALSARTSRANAVLAEGGRNARARATAARQGRAVDVNRSQQTGITYDKSGRIIRYRRGPGKGKPVRWKESRHKGTRSKSGGGGGASGLGP